MMKHFFLFLAFSMLVTACSDCECKVVNSEPNFNVKVSYKLAKNSFNIFSEDTVMMRYTVTVNPNAPNPKVFIGESNPSNKNAYGNAYITWYDGNSGEETGVETANSLALCLKMSGWRNDAEMEEYIDAPDINSVTVPDSIFKPTKVELIDDK